MELRSYTVRASKPDIQILLYSEKVKYIYSKRVNNNNLMYCSDTPEKEKALLSKLNEIQGVREHLTINHTGTQSFKATLSCSLAQRL